jgi:DnaK suppressor protein
MAAEAPAKTVACPRGQSCLYCRPFFNKGSSGGLCMPIELPEGYTPSVDEEYMSPMQLEYFKRKLLGWRAELIKESENTISHLKEENWQEPDINDRATLETDAALELRTRDRYRKLVNKIDSAMARIADGTYGYCEDTGEEIGLNRLEARPIATMSIEAQEKHERLEKQHRDD